MPCVEHTQKSATYGVAVHEGRATSLHRVVYMRHHGLSHPAIKGLVVRHTCDNPRCVNPEHLLLGTQRDNVGDMWSRGRAPNIGAYRKVNKEDHGMCKLTADNVAAIRAATGTQRQIARQFNMSQSQVQRIRAGAGWT